MRPPFASRSTTLVILFLSLYVSWGTFMGGGRADRSSERPRDESQEAATVGFPQARLASFRPSCVLLLTRLYALHLFQGKPGFW